MLKKTLLLLLIIFFSLSTVFAGASSENTSSKQASTTSALSQIQVTNISGTLLGLNTLYQYLNQNFLYDIDIDKGGIRFRPHGSAGTHNGMRSIVSRLNSEDFPRLRIGSKNTNPAIPLIDYVLMNIPAEEKTVILPALNKAADCAEDFAAGVEFDKLSCKYNAR